MGRYGSDALEFKLANCLDRDGVLDRHQDTRANEYLTGLGFVAKAGCNVGHRPDGGKLNDGSLASLHRRRYSV